MFTQLNHSLPGIVGSADLFDSRAGKLIAHHVFEHLPVAVTVDNNDLLYLFRRVVNEHVEPEAGLTRVHPVDVDNHLAALPGYLKHRNVPPS